MALRRITSGTWKWYEKTFDRRICYGIIGGSTIGATYGTYQAVKHDESAFEAALACSAVGTITGLFTCALFPFNVVFVPSIYYSAKPVAKKYWQEHISVTTEK